jgi:Rps23 Pro-64 3,4-dihydroxylase Tpa1-like proline 4-hydroxylase
VQPKLIARNPDPFPHFVVAEFYEPEVADGLNRWLSQEATWRRSVQRLYDQFELSFKLVPAVPDAIQSAVLAPAALSRVQRLAEHLFETELRPHVTVDAHKMTPGQGIGIHADSMVGEDSHRIVVQLSRAWRPEFGGNLVFFGGAAADDARQSFEHVFNTAIGFALSEASYHAVTQVVQGERLTVIYGFWSAASAFDQAANAWRTFSCEP